MKLTKAEKAAKDRQYYLERIENSICRLKNSESRDAAAKLFARLLRSARRDPDTADAMADLLKLLKEIEHLEGG